VVHVAHAHARLLEIRGQILGHTFRQRCNQRPFACGNSLPHLLTSQELTAALSDFFACLVTGGLLLIQNRNFDAVLADHNRWMEPQAHTEGENEWVFQRFYDFEPGGLIRFNIVTLHRRVPGEWQASISSTHLAPQTRQELEQALLTAGFTQIQSFGSLENVTFDPAKSGNLVILAKRP